ncbi:MAG: ATP synthase subunit C [Planctomycetes bacterium]|jgi:V/A-type H+-transporting ATPase subunit K|nr:ATP synthase subunit C [Planctomycetota bacterium]HPY75411.1 ATP synthase subunit C [Planctomycetota bacterium]HQB01024.1 ATP synthase subunit C [Planctomycetota bacterium]
MEEFIKWLGIMSPFALGAIGSSVGCLISGNALVGSLTRTKQGHGGFIALSAAPSSQIIYGLVLMMSMKNSNAAPGMLLALGLLCGIAIMVSALMQAKCCAAGMRATVEEPSIYGKCWVPVGIIESFAVFAMVFGIVSL